MENGKYLMSFEVGRNIERKPTMLNIVNFCDIEDNIVTFVNRQGEHKLNDSHFEFVKFVKEDDIDIKNSLHYWFKKNRQHQMKQLVKDDSITEGEIFRGNCWIFELMLKYDENNVYYKIILE